MKNILNFVTEFKYFMIGLVCLPTNLIYEGICRTRDFGEKIFSDYRFDNNSNEE